MPPDFVLSTIIIDFILGHLDSPHSITTLVCLLEVAEHRKIYNDNGTTELSPEVSESSKQKIALPHTELLGYFKLYSSIFETVGGATKHHLAYKKMNEQERMSIKMHAIILSSLYSNWIHELNLDRVKQGFGHLINLTKIEDMSIYNEIFPFWTKFIYRMYSAHHLRIPTTKPSRRNNFAHIFEAMLPVSTNNMPRPEEVFILGNDLVKLSELKKLKSL